MALIFRAALLAIALYCVAASMSIAARGQGQTQVDRMEREIDRLREQDALSLADRRVLDNRVSMLEQGAKAHNDELREIKEQLVWATRGILVLAGHAVLTLVAFALQRIKGLRLG